jgi:chemosensory pili system protein ChpB (putative protein-glutamate methylesterase)
MKGKHNRVGIIASTALVQHQLQWVISDAGYEVAVNTSPERLNKLFLANETIRLWVVELADDGQWNELLQEMLELTQVPILFGEGQLPGKNDEDYPRWRKRMQQKMHALAPVLEAAVSAPKFDLDTLLRIARVITEGIQSGLGPDMGIVCVPGWSAGGQGFSRSVTAPDTGNLLICPAY